MEEAAMNWKRVTRANVCPICGKPDWCRVFGDGWAECMRITSEHEAKSGGWMHRTSDNHAPMPKPRFRPSPPPVDMGGIWAECIEATDPEMLATHAGQLGLPVEALAALGCAWYAPGNAWAWPMWAGGRCCGIRLRNAAGKKWAVPGSQAGLFVSDAEDDALLICEGPTDTASALALGFAALGRPSCLGQEDMVKAHLFGVKFKHLVIVSDRDEPKKRPDGSVFFPGQQGADRLAKALGRPLRVRYPPAKDFREWVKRGATRAEIECVIQNSGWRNCK